MLGNLSKTLIKAPHYFNNNSDIESKNFSKISKEVLLDTYSNIRRLNSRNDNYRYFKERDFVKKHLKLDLNYNNNFRKEITPKVRTRPCVSFEEFIYGNSNVATRNNTRNVTKKSLYETNKSNLITDKTFKSNLTKSFDSKIVPNTTKRDKFNHFFDNKLISKDSIEEFNVQIKSNINNLIDKLNNNSLNLSGLGTKFEKNRIENLKEFINRNTVVEPPIKLKFPEINIQTQDNLYRDAMDKKLNSLSMVSPKVKEQLKSKNRVFASERDFYRYNNSYAMYQKNPFYESIKLIEETNKNENI